MASSVEIVSYQEMKRSYQGLPLKLVRAWLKVNKYFFCVQKQSSLSKGADTVSLQSPRLIYSYFLLIEKHKGVQ